MKKIFYNPILIFPVVFISVLTVPLPSHSRTLTVTPSLTLEESWDSNVFSRSENEESDFFFRARPNLALTIIAFRTAFNLNGGIEIEKYSKFDQLDSSTAAKIFQLNTEEPIQVTSRLSLRPEARFLETRDSTRRNELTSDPVTLLPVSSRLVTQRTDVRQYSAVLPITYQITPSLEAGIGASGSKTEYLVDNTALQNSETVTGDGSISYQMSPRSSIGMFIHTGYTSFETSPSVRTYSAALGGSYRWSEHLGMGWRAGANVARETRTGGTGKEETWGPSGQLSFDYSVENLRVIFFSAYGLGGGEGFGGTSRRGRISLSVAQQLEERWSWGITGSFQSIRSADETVRTDYDVGDGTAHIQYAPLTWLSVRLAGNITRQWTHGVTGSDFDLKRESVLLGLTLSKSYNIY